MGRHERAYRPVTWRVASAAGGWNRGTASRYHRPAVANQVESDISVQRFGFTGDDAGRRLKFPHAESHDIEGRAGAVAYGAKDVLFENLEGRLDTLRWTGDAASIGGAWLRDDKGRFDIACARVERSRGVLLPGAARGVERGPRARADPRGGLGAARVVLPGRRPVVKGPFGRSGQRPPTPGPTGEPGRLRQDKLRFLDSLSGRIYLTVKVVLDLPVLGVRTLD